VRGWSTWPCPPTSAPTWPRSASPWSTWTGSSSTSTTRQRHRDRGRPEAGPGEVSDFLGVRRAAQVAPTGGRLAHMASDVVAAELRRLESRLPGLDDHERSEVQRTVRRIGTSCCTRRPSGSRSCPATRRPRTTPLRCGSCSPSTRRPLPPCCPRKSAPSGSGDRAAPPGRAHLAAGPGPGRAGRGRAHRSRRSVDVCRGDHPGGRRPPPPGRDRRHRAVRRRGPGGPFGPARSTSRCTRSRTCRPAPRSTSR
jgi:hypothetical protein